MGNAMIGSGTKIDLGGGGIWVSCSHLRVLNSTVTLNTAPYGAGIEGESYDQLELANSIVVEDSPGDEIAGFAESEGGSLMASFSDVCATAGSSEPLPGAGNICANPLLTDNGNPVSFDVHETASSPTIDAGSNALVPSGLTTDFFGTTRILAGHAGCTDSFPAVVDMGTAEFEPAVPSCPATVQEQTPTTGPAAPTAGLTASAPATDPSVDKQVPAPGLAHFVSLKLSSTGIALRLSCSSTDGQGCSGTTYITANETLQGKKVVAVGASNRTKAPVRIARHRSPCRPVPPRRSRSSSTRPASSCCAISTHSRPGCWPTRRCPLTARLSSCSTRRGSESRLKKHKSRHPKHHH